jgi:SAM-dependent methyltransferase
MIQRARRKAEQTSQDLELRVGDAAALDIADATYDLVVARHVIWNLPDPQRGLAEWLRVLRPGGRLALIEGKWADNQSLAQAHSRPASRLLARVVDVAAALTLRIGRHPRKLLGRQYWRLEARLPFSGGIEAARLAEFLGVNGLRDVAVEPLMDPVLWGEPPRFPRYLATGARSEGEQPG